MARAKQTIVQRDFSFGVLRPDFLEGKDLEVRGKALRGGKNIRVMASRTIKARPGTRHRRTLTTADDVIEIRPASGLAFGVIVNDASLEVIDENMTVVHTVGSVAWTDASDVWVEPDREKTFIGCPQGVFILTYTSGSWSYGAFAFDTAAGGSLAQPYWAYNTSVTLTPSAATGAITVTSSGALFSAAYVGQRIRYNGSEIQITGYTSPTQVSGTVITRLPPSYDIVVGNANSFRVGDAVVAQDSNFQGLITAIATNTLSVTTIQNFPGPDVNETISGPRGSSTVSSKTSISLLASPLWDEPLMSPARGYPGSCSQASGRLVFCDFPNAPDVVAISSARTKTDFELGADDDDAIVRQVGDNSPRFLHAVNAGDLLLLSDRGCYYVPLRDSGVLSPSTFNALLFDKRAANDVRPVQIDGGVVFVEGSGKSIAAALLDGNIYLKWSVRTISDLHAPLIKTPKKLCAPPIYSTEADKYLFAVNDDGTLAVVSWVADFGSETIGFLPWDTDGEFINIAPVFGSYFAIVDRNVSGSIYRFLEEFDETAYLDCTGTYIEGAATHLPDTEVHLWNGGWYGGITHTNIGGMLLDNGNVQAEMTEYGYNFVATAKPWPVEHIDVPWVGMKNARLIRSSVSVMDTRNFQMRGNGTTRTIQSYAFGNDLGAPPDLKTNVFRMNVFGNRAHPEIEVIKHEPGPFHVLAIAQEVQA